MTAALLTRPGPLGALLSLLAGAALLLGPGLSPYPPDAMDFAALLVPPSLAHPFGTDSYGRDVLTRVLLGARLSLVISAAGVGLAAVVGTALGLVGGERGGGLDAVLARLSDLLFAFPSFVLALFLVVVMGTGTGSLVFAIALIYVPVFARLSRALTLSVRGEPYVQAARLLGQSTSSILVREILPNIAAPLLVQATTGLAFAVVIEAGLSFLGLGVQPPRPSLGTILADGREYFRQAPWVLTLTGAAMAFGLLGLNLLADGLRDLVDPRLRRSA